MSADGFDPQQALEAPVGDFPGQRGLMHPPEGVALVYGPEIVPVDVVWHGWHEDTPTQVYEIVMTDALRARTDRPTSLQIAVFPGETSIVFPALVGMEPPE